MKTTFPSGVDPTLGNSPNPFVEHVVSVVMNAPYQGVAEQDMEHVCRGILALATSRSFDLNHKAGIGKPKIHGGVAAEVLWKASPLDAVMFLGGVRPQGLAPARINWPRQISDFSSSLLVEAKRGLDLEWVAACLLAAGANPWNEWDKASEELPFCVSQAIRMGYAGLLERMMECPGAPAWQKLGEMVPAGHVWWENVSFPETEWSQMFSTRSAPCLEALLDHASLPQGKRLVGLLREASPEAVDVFTRKDQPSLTEAQTKSIQSSWREKVKKGKFDAETVEKMASVFWSGKAMSRNALAISKLVSTPWGKDMDYATRSSYENLDAAQVVSQEVVSSGAMAGRWNVLSAFIFSMLRQYEVSAPSGWSTDRLVADLGPGSLRNAFDFEWREGISANGIALLGVFSQGERDPSNLSVGKKERIGVFFNAIGVSSRDAWIKQHASDAARFIVDVLARPSQGGCIGMAKAISNAPEIIREFSEQERADVFKAIVRYDFCMSSEKDRISALARDLLWYSKGLSSLGYATLDHSPIRSGIFIHWLARSVADASKASPSAAKEDPMEIILGHSDLSCEEKNSIERFVAEMGPSATPRWISLLQAFVLDRRSAPVEHDCARPRSPRL